MTQEETSVLDYLKSRPESAFAKREIARKAAGRNVYDEDPHWADAPLASLVNQSLIVLDNNGNYHIPREDLG